MTAAEFGRQKCRLAFGVTPFNDIDDIVLNQVVVLLQLGLFKRFKASDV